jgi:hypothetical protein
MRATPLQKAHVVHITWGSRQYKQWQGTLTGVILDRHDTGTLVQMYSAGCMHNIVSIPTAEILAVTPYE